MSTFDQEVMARTAIGEARGEGADGMQAVMWSGVNRFTRKRWFSGKTLAGTFLKRMQYSCWTPEDVNYAYIANLDPIDPLLVRALMWADCVIKGMVTDPTLGATHYYADGIPAPAWTKNAAGTVKIGRHSFFKNVD